MIRTQVRYTSTPPGRAIGTSVNGDTWTTDYLLAPYWRIIEVGTDGSGRVKVKTAGKHGLTTGQKVETVIDGYNGTTKRAHPGNVTNLPTNNPPAAKTVEVIDEYWVSLVGTTAVANSAFWQGLLWRTGDNVTAAAVHTGDNQTGRMSLINSLITRVSEAGGGIINLPAGFIGAEVAMFLKDNVIVIGAGEDITNIVEIDGNDGPVIREYASKNAGITDCTIWPLRQRKSLAASAHAVRAGLDGANTHNLKVLRVYVRCSDGYGVALQDSGWFSDCELDLTVDGSSSDCLDIKNRMNINAGNKLNIRGRNCSLLWIGVDGPVYNFNANPFTMTSGSSIVNVAWSAEIAANPAAQPYWSVHGTITYPNAGTYRGINMGGSFQIVGQTGTGYQVETNQTASSSGTAGGTGLLEWPALCAQGDACFDLRGEGWSGGEIWYEGAMHMQSGPRFRGGTTYPTNPQGLGAGLSTLVSIFSKNTSPYRTNALGLSMEAWQCIVPAFQGEYMQEGVFFGSTSTDNSVGTAQLKNCVAGVVFRGSRNKVNVISATDTGTAALVLLGDDHCIGSVGGTGLTVGTHIYSGTNRTQVNDWQGVEADIKVIDAGTDSIFTPALPYHRDVYLWAHAVVTAGYTTNDTELGWLNDFIESEGAAYDLAYDYWPLGVPLDPGASLISLKYRVNGAASAGVTHVPRVGWQGGTGAIDTGLNPSTVMSATGQGHLSAFIIDSVSGGAKTVAGVSGGSAIRLQPRTAGNRVYAQMLSQLGTFATATTDTKGYRSVQRDNTADLLASIDATALTPVVVGSLSATAPNNSLWILAHNNGGSLIEATDATVFMVCLSRPISPAQDIARAANFEALATATGAWP